MRPFTVSSRRRISSAITTASAALTFCNRDASAGRFSSAPGRIAGRRQPMLRLRRADAHIGHILHVDRTAIPRGKQRSTPMSGTPCKVWPATTGRE